MSSANFKILLDKPVSKSFMKMRNKTGPSTEPCGTPLHTGLGHVWVEEASPGVIQGAMTDGLVEVIGVTCPTVYPWAGFPQTGRYLQCSSRGR